ncbi:MAG: pirin family protein [Ectothiorhodospiraceae bacterium]|nr:pirin family protein [Ectothiorhodospiraceae bacterium]
MFDIRRSQDRGVGEHGGWLKSRHSFSFADYVDPDRMGFSVLRVINEDRVTPGEGFATHAHRDMEIISMVLNGRIAHKDSMGNVTELPAGEVQRMSAGTGVTHSEYNPSQDEPLHFLQIWIEPKQLGIEPGYEQKVIADVKDGPLSLLVSPDGREGSVSINQDVSLYLGRLGIGDSLEHVLDPKRAYYVQVIRGDLQRQNDILSTGDALAIDAETVLALKAEAESEFLLFDLPPRKV